MRIDMLVYNRCTSDARVLKEAGTLARAGHDVRIVAVRDETTVEAERREGFRIARIRRNPLHYRLLGATRDALRYAARRWGTAAEVPVAVDPPADGPHFSDPAPLASERRRGADEASGAAGWAPWVIRAGGALGRFGYRRLRRLLVAVHKPLMFLDWYGRAYRLVVADPPQALHAHDLITLPAAVALARRLDLRLVYDAHELYPEMSTLSRRERHIWTGLERLLAPQADDVITVCESIAGELAERYGVARPEVLLNCPVRIDPPDRARSPLRTFVGDLPDGEPIVLYQGGFALHRGLPALIRAAGRLRRGVVVLMGWGTLEEELRRLVATEGLADRVRIVPPVPAPDVLAHAAGADIGVIPYEPVGLNNTYTTPNKLFDYMTAGLPVVASRLPELRRFVEGEGIGVTFTPGDPAAMAAAIQGILDDPGAAAAMRARAHAAAERYTWEGESRKLLALYSH